MPNSEGVWGRKKETIILCIFVLLKFVTQYNLVGSDFELNPDAYLYLDQGKHLAWGYLSVPPFLSWISFVILHLGTSLFLIRFFPTLFGALTIVMVWQIIRELEGGLYALILGALAILLSVILIQDIMYWPNSFDVLCWTTLYFIVIKYINTRNDKWFFIAAIVFAIGFLNKYTIIFWLLGMMPALVISKYRIIFRNRNFYCAILLTIVMISPNIIWQIQNDYPVFWHLNALENNFLIEAPRSFFLKSQISYFYGSNFVILAAFVSFFRFDRFKGYQLFFWAYIFSLSILIYFKSKATYALPLYPVFIAFGAVSLEKYLSGNTWKRYIRVASLLIIILSFIPSIYLCFPIKPMPVDQSKELPSGIKYLETFQWREWFYSTYYPNFINLIGNKELANKVDNIYDTLQDKSNTVVFCDTYGQAGAINYYSKNKNIRVFNIKADYINWIQLDTAQIKNVISVVLLEHYQEILDVNNKSIHPPFKSVQILEQIESPCAGEYGTRICLLQKPTISINKFINEAIENKKESRKGKGKEVIEDILNLWKE